MNCMAMLIKFVVGSFLLAGLTLEMGHAASSQVPTEELLSPPENGDSVPESIPEAISISPVSTSPPEPTSSPRALGHQHLAPFLGLWRTLQGPQQSTDYNFGFQVGFGRRERHIWETGALVVANTLGGRIHFKRTWGWNPPDWRGTEVLLSYGGGLITRPEDGMLFFSRLRNFLALGSVGLQHPVNDRLSLRADMEMNVGTQERALLTMLSAVGSW